MIRQIAAQEFVLTDSEFDRLRAVVHRHTGISLSDAKRELVYGRLARRLRKLKLASFAEYCTLVEEKTGELQELTNAITTNLTSFFREDYHFAHLATEVLPELERERAESQRIRLWSAGCSSGEEPYSLAVILNEALAHLSHWDIKLLATDIDSQMIAAAEEGVYGSDRLKGLAADRLARWFPQAVDRPDCRAASAELKRLITFRRLNLMDSWPMKGPFDIIFCRNVIIYFDKDTQHELLERMAGLQRPGGWLFVGHSENLFNVTHSYKLVGRTTYRRVA
jgi:chemotaxis protein methyltransferase CheR